MRCWSVSALGARGHRSFSCTTPRTTGSMVQSDARRRSGKARRIVWPSWSGRVDRRSLASTRRARAAGCSAISGGRLGRTMAREHGHGAQHYPAEPRRSMSLARVPRAAVEPLGRALPEPWSRSSRSAGDGAPARLSPAEDSPGAVRRALLSAPLSPSDGRAAPLPDSTAGRLPEEPPCCVRRSRSDLGQRKSGPKSMSSSGMASPEPMPSAGKSISSYPKLGYSSAFASSVGSTVTSW